ncbi:MAG: hypothetical protein WBB07_17525 [Mycobacterium sp.]
MIEVTSHAKGNHEIHTQHDGQRIVLVHVRKSGELVMGGKFRTGGFGIEWVALLLEALKMAVDIQSDLLTSNGSR